MTITDRCASCGALSHSGQCPRMLMCNSREAGYSDFAYTIWKHQEERSKLEAELHKLRGSAERMKAVVEAAKPVLNYLKATMLMTGECESKEVFRQVVELQNALKALETGA